MSIVPQGQQKHGKDTVWRFLHRKARHLCRRRRGLRTDDRETPLIFHRFRTWNLCVMFLLIYKWQSNIKRMRWTRDHPHHGSQAGDGRVWERYSICRSTDQQNFQARWNCSITALPSTIATSHMSSSALEIWLVRLRN